MIFDINSFLKTYNIDTFLIKDKSNIFYLTKKKVSFWILVLSSDNKYFISDARYVESLQDLKWWKIIDIKQIDSISKFIENNWWKSIGIEGDVWTINEYMKLKSNLDLSNIKLKIVSAPLKRYRMIKSDDEIKKIKEAINIISRVYKKLKQKFDKFEYIGLTEKDVQKDIICNILSCGGEWESFPSIVAFGASTSIPHRQSGYNKLKINSPVLIDMGCIYEWYCSDFTRSFWVGEKIDLQWQKIFDIVRKAFDAAWKEAIPWRKIKDVDLAARKVIEDAWYGKYFVHATWHGIWLNVHEYPTVFNSVEEVIQPWMVFTIEPGIYLPWKFWLRWEDIKIIM